MEPDFTARPNTVPWPPIIFLAVLLAALGLGAIWPLGLAPLASAGWLRITGIGFAAIGIVLDVSAMLAMRRARTNILPHRGADQLVTGGVFALTRNPIYLGNTLLLVGVGLVLSSAWMLAAALVAAVLVDRLAIRREERHLAARFGPAFVDYAARVPRWIGVRRPD